MNNQTPATRAGLRTFDHLPASEAIARAWQDPGRQTAHHRRMQQHVAETMPVLARALNRLPAAQRATSTANRHNSGPMQH